MEKIRGYYEYYKNAPSDINEHLPTLLKYAEECEHITEMGVRTCNSSWALLYSNPKKMISYDKVQNESINTLINIANEYLMNFEFKLNDVLTIEIEKTDLLFIDTWHTYNQLSLELELHSKNVNKYIILHDTVTYGLIDEQFYDNSSVIVRNKPKTKEGLMNAVNDFLTSENGSTWEIFEEYKNNNGLLILKRKK